METVTVLDGQSIFDIAIQHTGSVESAFEIAILNDLSLTDEIPTGAVLILTAPNAAAKTVREYFANRNLKPATSITGETLQTLRTL